ncbi:MAG TPA: efflux RND transporter periplasmic adaptor subunit [Burkholderiaceae bacterium]|nr:efflux RND transporter periplasmic adaptor subunit [Burkholderiaceae bacterium]
MPSSFASRRAPLFFLVAAALALSACGDESASGAAPPAPPPPQVTVVTLTPQQVTLTRELPGRVNPYLIAEVRPQVNGIVEQRLFTEGGEVKGGQALYQLDDATYKANHASAKATLARAKASLESARLTARRTAGLAKIDAVSKQQNEDATAALRLAEADVAAAEAALQSAEVTLGRARITAPISGQIGKSSVTAGALVTANQAQPLATIQQLDPIYVDLTQSSSELLQLRREVEAGRVTGARDVPVTILLEDGTPYSRSGKLTFADVTVDPATGSFLLRVEVPNPEKLLLPGMYVRAVVSNAQRSNALLVPQQGIARDPKGSTTAMVVDKDGKVELRPVIVNRTIGDKWLIDEGLVGGDRVVVEGLQKIRPGVAVEATEAPANEAANPQAAPAGGVPPNGAAQPEGSAATQSAEPASAQPETAPGAR